jgi:hypothetical protein
MMLTEFPVLFYRYYSSPAVKSFLTQIMDLSINISEHLDGQLSSRQIEIDNMTHIAVVIPKR